MIFLSQWLRMRFSSSVGLDGIVSDLATRCIGVVDLAWCVSFGFFNLNLDREIHLACLVSINTLPLMCNV